MKVKIPDLLRFQSIRSVAWVTFVLLEVVFFGYLFVAVFFSNNLDVKGWWPFAVVWYTVINLIYTSLSAFIANKLNTKIYTGVNLGLVLFLLVATIFSFGDDYFFYGSYVSALVLLVLLRLKLIIKNRK